MSQEQKRPNWTDFLEFTQIQDWDYQKSVHLSLSQDRDSSKDKMAKTSKKKQEEEQANSQVETLRKIGKGVRVLEKGQEGNSGMAITGQKF